MPIPRRSRRASSIARAGSAALSLSSKPVAAAGSVPVEKVALNNGSLPEDAATSEGRLRRIAFEDIDEPARKLLVASPAYPGGVGGRLTTTFSAPADGPGGGGSEASKQPRKGYRVLFDGGGEDAPRGEKTAGRAGAGVGLPPGLEAARDESDPTLLCVRELESVGTGVGGGGDGGGGGGGGRVLARIKASPTTTGGRESIHSVLLERGGGDQAGGEMMAVRVSTHPTRLAAPREVRAVLLLPPQGGGGQGKSHDQESDGYVWPVRVD